MDDLILNRCRAEDRRHDVDNTIAIETNCINRQTPSTLLRRPSYKISHHNKVRYINIAKVEPAPAMTASRPALTAQTLDPPDVIGHTFLPSTIGHRAWSASGQPVPMAG
jgi:hypothetical protein